MTLTTRVQFSRPRRRVWLPGGGGAALAATWSTTDKNGNVTMSNGNLTATTAAATFSAGRGDTATTLIGAGAKRFWGTRIVALTGSDNNAGAGFCNANNTFGNGAYLGEQAHGAGYYGDGMMYFNNGGGGSPLGPFATFVQGAIIWQALDRILGKWWFAVDDGSWLNAALGSQNPATGTGGLDVSTLGDVFPAYCVRNGGSVDLIRGPSFSRTPPSGFTGYQ